MINDFKYIKDKTLELEESLEKLHKDNLKTYKTFKTIEKDFINYSVLNSSKIILCDLSLTKHSNIFLSLTGKIYLSSAQTVEVLLLVDNICIAKLTSAFSNGENEILLNNNYTPLISSNQSVILVIKSLSDKQIELKNIKLLIYGLSEEIYSTKYQTLEINNEKLLISFLNNEKIYYLKCKKDANYFNSTDFAYLTNAKDYCFSYDEVLNKISLFLIDSNNNLIMSDLNMQSIFIIDTNCSTISAVQSNNQILVCYVKDFVCRYLIIENDSVGKIYNLNKFSNITKAKASFNKINSKFYIILTDLNKQNYLIESVKESFNIGENISATINFMVNTYEVNDEI